MDVKDDILQIIVDKNMEYEERTDDIFMGKKLKAIFEENLFKSGRLEISNIQLAEITGKENYSVTRDMKLEFGTILKRFGNSLQKHDDHDHLLIQDGLNMLLKDIRVEQEPNDRGKMRNVYYFSGLALTQLLSRWDSSIRFLINVTIHRLTEHLNKHGYSPNTMSELEDDVLLCLHLVNDLELAYMKLSKETTLDHIKANYKDTLSKLEEKRNEVMALKKRRKEIYPSLSRIIDEIRLIDKECADILGKRAKIKEYENQKDAKVAFERE